MKAIIFFLVLLSTSAFGQMTETLRDMLNGKGGKFAITDGSKTVFGVKSQNEGDIIGDTFLNAEWQNGGFKLYQKVGPPGREGDTVSAVPMRYDIYTKTLELMSSPQVVRVVPAAYLKYFNVNNKLFVNVKEFNHEDLTDGFMELAALGKKSVFVYTKIKVIRPTYNEAMNTGTKDTKILKEPILYIQEGKNLVKVPLNKKKILELLQDKNTDVEKYLTQNNPSFKDVSQVIGIFKFYNGL